MRTTIELPDVLLMQAKSRAALRGISLKDFFIEAIGKAVAPEKAKVRRPPPTVPGPRNPRVGLLTREQIDEAMFG